MDSATPRKKARLDLENVEPFADEPWDITEDQLEELDILASQAITHEDHDVAPTPRKSQTQKKYSGTTVAKTVYTNSSTAPPNSSSFSSSLFAPVEQQKKLYQQPTTGITYAKASVVNTHNPYTTRNAAKVYDRCPTATKSLAWTSSCSTPDITAAAASQRQTRGSASRIIDQSTNFGRRTPVGGTSSVKVEYRSDDASNGMLKKMQDELQKCKDEKKILLEEQDAKVGEVKLLRESLSRSQAALDHERQEHVKVMSQQSDRYEADLSSLQGRLNTSKTELVFMKQEVLNKQTKCDRLELRLKQCSLQDGCTPRLSSVSFNSSPKKLTTPKTNTFLSRFSFDKSGPLNPSASVTDASVQVDTSADAVRRRKTKLETKLHQGLVPSVRVMSHLLHTDTVSHDDPLGGLLSLLQVQSSKDLVLLNGPDKKMSPSSSDRSTALLSRKLCLPIPPYRTSGTHAGPADRLLAVQGLESLLRSGTQEAISDSAATLIPLIEDRIVTYRDVILFFADSQGLMSAMSTLSSYKSSSLESYFSSLSSASSSWLSNAQLSPATLEMMENMVTVALNVLHKLVSLRPSLMGLITSKPYRSCSDSDPKIKDDPRYVGADGQDGNQDSPASLRTGIGNNPDVSPLRADVDFVEHIIATTHVALAVEKLVNLEVAAAFLEVLLDMVKFVGECTNFRVKRLFSSGALNNCFRPRCEERVVILCLKLAEEIIRSSPSSTSWLCGGCQDACFLYQLANLGQHVHTMFTSEITLRITTQIFSFLSTMVMIYQRSAPLVLDSDTCGNCSRELLLSVICMFNKEIFKYRSLTPAQANLLRYGLRLFHHLSVVDVRFSERRSHSEKQYITLVCKIMRLVNNDKGKFLPFEVTIIQELKDFESDDDEAENDPENETSMDTGPS